MTEITKITRSEEITYNAGITRNIEIIRYTKVVFSFMSVYLRLAVSDILFLILLIDKTA